MGIRSKAGLGTGFGIFGILFIFATIRVLVDEIQRHKGVTKDLLVAQERMRELGLDVSSVDEQYELSKKPVKEEEVVKGPVV